MGLLEDLREVYGPNFMHQKFAEKFLKAIATYEQRILSEVGVVL